MEYRLEADWEVFHFLRNLKKTDEKQLIRWIDRVRNTPFLGGNYTVRDAVDREIQVTKVGRFLVFHWSDHAVKTIRVNAIEEIN